MRPWLHELVDKVPDENPIKRMLRTIEHLAQYATSYRYPKSKGLIPREPTHAELVTDIQMIADVLIKLADYFQVELDRKHRNQPAGSVAPIR